MGTIHLDVPDDLHRQAKAEAAHQGETLRAMIERAIRTEVDRLRRQRERRDDRG